MGNSLSVAVTFSPAGSLSRVAWWVALLTLGLCLVGCGPDEPEGPPEPSARLEVGTGGSFTALEEGGTLDLYRGCQGSQHVFVSLRAWELTNLRAQVRLSLERASDGASASADYKVRLRFDAPLNEGDPALLEGLLLQVSAPDKVVGQEVRLKASILSEADESAADTRTVTLQWGPPSCG